MTLPSNLCDRCFACLQSLDSSYHGLGNTAGETANNNTRPCSDHHQSFDSFEVALRKPCLICNYLKSHWLSSSDTKSFASTWHLLAEDPHDFLVHFSLRGEEDVLVHLKVVDHKQAVSRHSEDLVAECTSNDKVLEQAKSWLEYCEAEHSSCIKRSSLNIRYPSRLIDLFPDQKPARNGWKLIDQTSSVEGGYVTLSHRWGIGSLEPYKLTRHTYENVCNGLPDTCLSGTYRDAMRVTRRLGIRYLWIDSLCIPQDKGTLKIQVEACKMADVYSYSVCNLAALTADQDTIFVSRDPLLHSPAATMVPASPHGLLRSYAILLSKSWERSVLQSPLSRRAWVLQEQLLPHKILYFGATQLLWSCLDGAFCELYPLDEITLSWLDEGMYEGDLGSIHQNLGYAGNASASSKKDFLEVNNDRTAPGVDWTDLLMIYGQRQLTHAGDKLLAIAGISQQLGSIRNDTIIGGLVVRELPENLLWLMDHAAAQRDHLTIQRNSVSRAPSWSWAYYDGPIARGGGSRIYRDRRVAQLIKIDSDVKKISEIKVARGGDLCLLAASLPLTPLSPLVTPHNSSTGQTLGTTHCWWMSFSSALTIPHYGSDPNEGLKLLATINYDENEEGWDGESNGRLIFDLPDYFHLQGHLVAVFITSTISSRRFRDTQLIYRFDGLVLRQHPGRGEGVFERIGLFAVTVYAEKGYPPEIPMIKLWNLCDVTWLEDHSLYTDYDFDAATFMREYIIA